MSRIKRSDFSNGLPAMPKPSPKAKPQPNVLFEATVRRMLATPPQPKKPVKKKAVAKRRRATGA